MESLKTLFLIAMCLTVGTYLFSETYKPEVYLVAMCLLTIGSIYVLLTVKERLYRVFASLSLTIVVASIGTALLRLSGLTG